MQIYETLIRFQQLKLFFFGSLAKFLPLELYFQLLLSLFAFIF